MMRHPQCMKMMRTKLGAEKSSMKMHYHALGKHAYFS